MIWTDCASAISQLSKILEGQFPAANGPHSDLWVQVFHAVGDLPAQSVQVTKVQAHIGTVGSSPFEDWCLLHNNWADRTALRANFNRPASFWNVYNAHVVACAISHKISRAVQMVLLRVSQAAMKAQATAEPEEEPNVAPVRPPPGSWQGLRELKRFPSAAARWYGQTLVRKILSWWQHTLHGACDSCQWVSHFQLYLDFQLATGSRGPVHEKQWRDADCIDLVGLANYPFRLRARWVAKILKECLRHSCQPLSMSYTQPHSTVLGLYTGCVAVPWPQWRLDEVDRWIIAHVPFGIRRRGESLDILPFSMRDESWPLFPVSSGDF